MKKISQILCIAMTFACILSVTNSFSGNVVKYKPDKVEVSKMENIVFETSFENIAVVYLFAPVENTFSVKFTTIVLKDVVLPNKMVNSFDRAGYTVRQIDHLPDVYDSIKYKLWILTCNIRRC